jgi:hypothetical protein
MCANRYRNTYAWFQSVNPSFFGLSVRSTPDMALATGDIPHFVYCSVMHADSDESRSETEVGHACLWGECKNTDFGAVWGKDGVVAGNRDRRWHRKG